MYKIFKKIVLLHGDDNYVRREKFLFVEFEKIIKKDNEFTFERFFLKVLTHLNENCILISIEKYEISDDL